MTGRSGNSEGGCLYLTQHTPRRESAAVITLNGNPPSDVWAAFVSDLIFEIAAGVDSIIADSDASPSRTIAQAVATGDVPGLEAQVIGSVVSSLSGPVQPRQWWSAVHFVRSLGTGDLLVGGVRSGIDEVCKVARLTDTDEPIVVHIKDEFEQQRADQRRDICRILTALSSVTDVYLVAETLRQQRWFAHTHRANLPGSLIDQCNTGNKKPSAKSETIQQAIERFDVDGGMIKLLRSVADAANETRTLDWLEAELGVDRDTIHNRLHHLRDYELISETLPTDDGPAVSLISTGRAYLDAVYDSSGVQTTIEESLIAGGKSSHNMPCNPAGTREGGDPHGWDRNRLPHLHETREIPRHRLQAAVASADNTDISVVDTNVGLLDDRAAPGIHYDHDDRILLVSAEYDNPMSFWVCVARALCNSRIWQWILSPDKLDTPHCDKFRTLFGDHKEVLRQLRCLGYTPNHITDIEEYRDYLLDAKEDLLELTQRLTNEDYPEHQDRGEFRGKILDDAHGLAGTMAHILDLVDVEIVREVRIPRYREFDRAKRQGLVKTIGVGASIQSVYGEATSYRQLYEHRPNKREQAFEPDVDARDPYAELIGSFAIVGDFKTQKDEFVDGLTSRLQPHSPHEDAPEFQIDLSIKNNLSRSEYALVTTKLCRDKNLKPTPEAISTLAGICNSPYEVAEALNYLQPNDDRRSIDSREVRYALAQLDADDILRGTSSTPRKVIIALLNAVEPLSQSELADRADVSTRSLRDHLPDLLDLGLIDEMPTGYRFKLAFDNDSERIDDRYPQYVVDPEFRPEIHAAAKAIKTGHEHHFGTPIPDAEFPRWGGRQACADLREIDKLGVWITDVLPLLWGLACRDVYRTDEKIGYLTGGSQSTTVRLGPDIPQKRLSAYSGPQAAR